MDDVWVLVWGFVFGTIGMGYAIYGKNQRKPIPLICGITMAMIPYFIDNSVLLVLSGMVLMAIPYFVRL